MRSFYAVFNRMIKRILGATLAQAKKSFLLLEVDWIIRYPDFPC